MAYQGFVFSDETASLSEAEYSRALGNLDKVAELLELRKALSERNPEKAAIINPDSGWHPGAQLSFEQDNATKNFRTSYDLLARGDRDIIRKMRLYGHVFTGYQLATLEQASKRPWLSEKLPDDWDDTLRRLAGPPLQSVFDYVSVAYALPDELRISPPRKFGEIGWQFDDVIVNDDAYGYQQLFSLMFENGLIDLLKDRFAEKGTLRILEIGGGYGALAYHITQLFDQKVHYAIVDIPESLAFSSIYCSTLLPEMKCAFVEDTDPFYLEDEPGLTFIPNMLYDQLAADDSPLDLCLNTLSLAEMSVVQIKDYLESIKRFIGSTGIFFEQNHQNTDVCLGEIFPRYFKNLRRCETELVRTYPERRGEANLWVNFSFES